MTKARGAKSDDSYKDGSFEASKTTTVTRIATSRGPIPVTVGTFERFGLGRGGTIPWGGVWDPQDREHISILQFMSTSSIPGSLGSFSKHGYPRGD